MVVAGLNVGDDVWALAGLPMSLSEDLVFALEPVCDADLVAVCLG